MTKEELQAIGLTDEQAEAVRKKFEAQHDELSTQVSKLRSESEKKDKTHAAEMKQLKRETIDERLLTEAKIINPRSAKPFLDAIDDNADEADYASMRKKNIDALVKGEDTAHLFRKEEKPTFTGVKPGESGAARPANNGVNPFAKDTYNEQEQIKLYRADPNMAKAMAKQAGLPVL